MHMRINSRQKPDRLLEEIGKDFPLTPLHRQLVVNVSSHITAPFKIDKPDHTLVDLRVRSWVLLI